MGIGILKCSIAYVMASMGTFMPLISNFLGDSFGKHMMATVTVYFHPARSLGSMFKALVCAAIAFVYAVFISFSSMGVSILFDDHLHKLALGHAIVLIVFCGGGLGFVGWTKQSLSDPLVNVGCSLTSLTIITVLTREGAVQSTEFSPHKIIQVLKMIAMGVGASVFVNLAIKPVSARRDLRQNLIDITDSLAEMLAGITRAFLTGSESIEQSTFVSSSDRYKKTFAAMTKNAAEAQWEHYVLGTESQSKLEVRLVKSIQQMYQSLGGLRSAAATQFHLLSQSAPGSATPISASVVYSPMEESSNMKDYVTEEHFATLAAIAEASDEDGSRTAKETPVGFPAARSPADIFERFIMHLGPSLKSLAYTLKQILDELPCTPGPEYDIKVDSHFHSSLVKAIDLYSNARKNALSLLYRTKDLAASRPEAVEADFEEVAASCGHFSYSLLNFAEEMKNYLLVLDELKNEVDQPVVKRTWKWLRFWDQPSSRQVNNRRRDMEHASVHFQGWSPGANGMSEFASTIKPQMKLEKTEPRRDISYRIWRASKWVRREDIKFAIKVGIGAALYALPSFVPAWRPFYQLWRGEWGLLSYMLVCSMTIGAANTTSAARIFGTIVGALCSMAAWTVSGGNVFILCFLGWIMSLWNFYIIVGKGQGPFGRFIMLTYNLTALYAYALSVKVYPGHEDEGGKEPRIAQIALHRVVAVISGCLWGMFITRVIWPISARRKFRDGLSLLLLRMGLIWKRDPLAYFLEGESQHSYLDLKEELQLQRYLRQLEGLCTAAASEYQLKGPFPTATYRKILNAVGRMLDAFHAINVMIMKDPVASEGETLLLEYTAIERANLCQMISHLFQGTLSSSLPRCASCLALFLFI